MLTFIKLGGSLITNKQQSFSARQEVITRLVHEIHRAQMAVPDLQIILGHGSGSFGHTEAQKYQTHLGVQSTEDWHGFIQVRRQADVLHRIVMDTLWTNGLDAISFPPSAMLVTNDHTDIRVDLQALQLALHHDLLPVVFGDVVFDHSTGGTIISTEQILAHLCDQLPIQRILLAGMEKGVWKNADDPHTIFKVLTPAEYSDHAKDIKGSTATDVTGGMRTKVEILFSILHKHPDIEAVIFSGEQTDNLFSNLTGKPAGTLLKDS